MKKSIFLLIFAIELFKSQASGDTIVAIHGFIADWRCMKPIERVFQPCGFDVFLWEYESRRKCILHHASDLNATLQKIACAFPGRPIHFVAHSIGALVLRLALNLRDCPNEAKIGRAILLAPPNQGAILARRFQKFWPIEWAMGDKSGWELGNYGPREMACLGEFPSSMDVLIIAGTKGNKLWFSAPNDGYVTVKETRLNTPHCFESFSVNHGEILKNFSVLCRAKKFIYDYYKPESVKTDSGLGCD